MTTIKETVEVPVDPIGKSSRGWLNIVASLVGAMMAVPSIQEKVAANPLIASLATAGFGIMNWLLLRKSKAGVVSKNVIVAK